MKRIILVAVATASLAMAGMVAAEVAKEHSQALEVQAVQQHFSEAPALSRHQVQAAPTVGAWDAVKAKLEAGDTVGALLVLFFGAGGVGLAMATLAANKPRAYELGNRNQVPVIASDIIYEGAAVGIVDGTGHARPLNAADRFAGFAEAKADNSAGAAAAINVDVVKSGEIELAVTGAVITDVGQPVYATDDDTFTFVPTSAAFIGFVKRFVSAGKVVVEFNAGVLVDPYGDRTSRETKSANYTLDAEDTGKVIFVDTDAITLTLPSIADGLGGVKIVNIGAFGAVAVTISPAALDKIHGPDITSADDKDLINTKATARRGDFVELDLGDADGYVVTAIRGTWARQA